MRIVKIELRQSRIDDGRDVAYRNGRFRDIRGNYYFLFSERGRSENALLLFFRKPAVERQRVDFPSEGRTVEAENILCKTRRRRILELSDDKERGMRANFTSRRLNQRGLCMLLRY